MNASSDIEDLLTDSPSLHASMPGIGAKTYEQARNLASKETALPLATFPRTMTADFGEALTAVLAGADDFSFTTSRRTRPMNDRAFRVTSAVVATSAAIAFWYADHAIDRSTCRPFRHSGAGRACG